MIESIVFFSATYLYIAPIILVGFFLYIAPKEERREIFFLGLVSLPLSFLLAKLGSFLYDSPRPFVLGHFTPLVPHADDNGFPSDHTLLLAALAMLFYYVEWRRSLFLWAFAVLVGFARVFAGVHHFIDIAGSIIIAIIATICAHFVIRYYEKRKSTERP